MMKTGHKPQHLARGTAKTTPGYVGRHRLDDKPSAAPDSKPTTPPEWEGHALIARNICPLHLDQPANNCAAGCTWWLPEGLEKADV